MRRETEKGCWLSCGAPHFCSLVLTTATAANDTTHFRHSHAVGQLQLVPTALILRYSSFRPPVQLNPSASPLPFPPPRIRTVMNSCAPMSAYPIAGSSTNRICFFTHDCGCRTRNAGERWDVDDGERRTRTIKGRVTQLPRTPQGVRLGGASQA